MTPDQYKSARTALGLTQIQLASKLGVSRRTIQNREQGKTKITREAQAGIEKLLKKKAPYKTKEKEEN